MKKTFDYVIVGAGSSGAVLANRLSKDSKNEVLLLEAGPEDNYIWVHIPVGYFKTINNPRCDWMYKTQPQESVNNRAIDWPRGKILGGSSSLNGLLYIRGDRQDYDNWTALGNKGWGYDDVLPYFIKSEDQENGANEYHGVGGALKVSNLRLRRPIADKFISACENIGIPLNPDCNGASQEGVGYFQQTAYKGLRCSTARAFLNKSIRSRKNLTVLTQAHVQRLLFEGKVAKGVEVWHKGEKKFFYAEEVILSAGAINSPHILQLSGIGCAHKMQALGIQTIHDNPAVGKNLQDHLQVRLVYKTRERTLNDELNTWWKKMLIGMQYAFFRTGPLTLCASQVYVFTNTEGNNLRPNIQFHVQPFSADKPSDGVHPFSAFTMSVCILRPKSNGEVVLKSANPMDKPLVYANYLSTSEDCALAVSSIKTARKIAHTSPLKEVIIDEHVPGVKVQSDVDLLNAARNYSQSIYHPVGTCKMGSDKDSVVDERLRVHGMRNLRVVDASIMPEIVSGNTNAPCIMIAEKAADMILQDNA